MNLRPVILTERPLLHTPTCGRPQTRISRNGGEPENRLHWSLDVTFQEDALRNRVGHSAENFSRIRRLALNLLRRDKTCKAGLKGKRLQACLKEDYLLRILSQGI